MTAGTAKKKVNSKTGGLIYPALGPPASSLRNLIDTLTIRKRPKSSRATTSEFLIDTNWALSRQRAQRSRLSPQSKRRIPPVIAHPSPLIFLIDSLPIGKAPNSFTFNKPLDSNRQKQGIFPELKPIASRVEHPESNRSSKKLKTNVTP
ncbi:MAG TPA: hypothetical protein VJS43_03475 [Candidatus Acidoferrales bacterium]|nr:hypothetical protein [Candidatus Acidoferrales bacterium]